MLGVFGRRLPLQVGRLQPSICLVPAASFERVPLALEASPILFRRDSGAVSCSYGTATAPGDSADSSPPVNVSEYRHGWLSTSCPKAIRCFLPTLHPTPVSWHAQGLGKRRWARPLFGARGQLRRRRRWRGGRPRGGRRRRVQNRNLERRRRGGRPRGPDRPRVPPIHKLSPFSSCFYPVATALRPVHAHTSQPDVHPARRGEEVRSTNTAASFSSLRARLVSVQVQRLLKQLFCRSGLPPAPRRVRRTGRLRFLLRPGKCVREIPTRRPAEPRTRNPGIPEPTIVHMKSYLTRGHLKTCREGHGKEASAPAGGDWRPG